MRKMVQVIGLQHSVNNGPWQTIQSFALSAGNHDRKYQWDVPLTMSGAYVSVEDNEASGLVSYSVIRKLNQEGRELISLFPNPAKVHVMVKGKDGEGLRLMDMLQRELKVRMVRD